MDDLLHTRFGLTGSHGALSRGPTAMVDADGFLSAFAPGSDVLMPPDALVGEEAAEDASDVFVAMTMSLPPDHPADPASQGAQTRGTSMVFEALVGPETGAASRMMSGSAEIAGPSGAPTADGHPIPLSIKGAGFLTPSAVPEVAASLPDQAEHARADALPWASRKAAAPSGPLLQGVAVPQAGGWPIMPGPDMGRPGPATQLRFQGADSGQPAALQAPELRVPAQALSAAPASKVAPPDTALIPVVAGEGSRSAALPGGTTPSDLALRSAGPTLSHPQSVASSLDLSGMAVRATMHPSSGKSAKDPVIDLAIPLPSKGLQASAGPAVVAIASAPAVPGTVSGDSGKPVPAGATPILPPAARLLAPGSVPASGGGAAPAVGSVNAGPDVVPLPGLAGITTGTASGQPAGAPPLAGGLAPEPEGVVPPPAPAVAPASVPANLPASQLEPARTLQAETPARVTVPDAIADPALDRWPVSEASGLGLGHGAAASAAPIADRAALPHLPQPAVPIPQQIAQALANPGRDPDVPLDLALDPPELGRVRLSFAEMNGTLTLTIAVERPETADLMRRHIALLNEEFARAGLDAPSVSISQGGADDRSQSRTAAPMTEAAAREALPDEQAPSHPDHSRSGPQVGLDLRL